LQSVGADLPEVEASEAGAVTGATQRLVLPRFLRKPARLLMKKEWRLPRYVGLKGMAALFIATATAGTLIGGHGTTVVAALTAWSGLAIDNVLITGQSETSEVDVLAKLAIDSPPSLVTFDVDAARARVETLPWVKQVTLKKFYPDTLQVKLVERTPYAIWQHDGTVSLIDRDGAVIVDDVGDDYAHLPFVVGPGAATRASEFVDLVDGVPALKPRIHAGVLISGRRWNVVLDNGVEILLPEEDPSNALVAVSALQSQNGLLDRDIAAVDLRLPDRLVVRLSDEGQAIRQAALKERDKLAKKKENT